MAHRVDASPHHPTRITFGDSAAYGTDVTYIRSRRVFLMGGWFDHIVGMESQEISLGDFLRAFRIGVADVQEALDAN